MTEQLTHATAAHPALLMHERERAQNIQNRIADRITIFAGSMAFVYIHIVWFGCGSPSGSSTIRTGCSR